MDGVLDEDQVSLIAPYIISFYIIIIIIIIWAIILS